METLFIKKNHDKRIKNGHLWIFSNELEELPDFNPGSIVEVRDSRGNSFGLAFFNPGSLISCRLLKTFHIPGIEFFIERITRAYTFRMRIFPNENMFRVVFGESDLLPGLIIDKYGDYLAVQSLSAGMEILMNIISESLLKIFPDTKGIICKNISVLRSIEGLPTEERIIFGEIPELIELNDGKAKMMISLAGSQKTGYYLDQRLNRKFIAGISSGLKILDCHTNQGSFAIHAALGGAEEITGIDSSASAIESARRNASANSIENITFIQSDVPEFLREQVRLNNKWDIIILDPPAFAKFKKDIRLAKIAYMRLNELALGLLKNGGILASSSCSQHLKEEDFKEIIFQAATKQKASLSFIYRGMQSPDHPVHLSMPETNYLKFLVIRKLLE